MITQEKIRKIERSINLISMIVYVLSIYFIYFILKDEYFSVQNFIILYFNSGFLRCVDFIVKGLILGYEIIYLEEKMEDKDKIKRYAEQRIIYLIMERLISYCIWPYIELTIREPKLFLLMKLNHRVYISLIISLISVFEQRNFIKTNRDILFKDKGNERNK
jgi:hypothetical protein